jgi:hypothetical protein
MIIQYNTIQYNTKQYNTIHTLRVGLSKNERKYRQNN